MQGYDHKKIEKKWQREWEKSNLYKIPDSKRGAENFYLLTEFAYPSGNLHFGHWYAFCVPDILARYLRMDGKNVLYPTGFDAFGLPAENAAIKNKKNPREWTYENIKQMRKQQHSMGAMFDWSREVITCDPEYYKWTQWMFVQLYKKGLAYRKETAVNWCPKDKTVLANEQVVNGRCERCDSEVVQKMMLQWNIKITDYADRLIDDLEKLDWPEQIKESQRNWIGKSEGAEIKFPLAQYNSETNFLLLHGFTGHAQKNFFPWLKETLENRGYRVQNPELPNTENPTEKEQVNHVLANCQIDKNTVIVGHSLGGLVAMKVLQCHSKPIKGLVLLASAIDPAFGARQEPKPRPFHKTFSWDIHYELLRKLAPLRIVVSDLSEVHRIDYLKHLAQKLGARLFTDHSNRQHITGQEEPMILGALFPSISIFTTRPDTLFGATYLVLAPEHGQVSSLQSQASNKDEVEKYIKETQKKTDLERQENKEKTGVELKGVKVINPATKEEISIFVADYVLTGYGTGAIMAVPAHDERDFEFAKKYNTPIRYVVLPKMHDPRNPHQPNKKSVFRNTILGIVRDPKTGNILCLKWKKHPWTTFIIGGIEEGESPEEAARREIKEESGYTNLKLIRVLGGPVHTEFFAAHKDVNRVAHEWSVLFELQSDEKVQISEEEVGKHEPMWLSFDALTDTLVTHTEWHIMRERILTNKDAYTREGVLVNSGEYTGLSSSEARKKITEAFGTAKNTYKLRDWVVSRQRYWGVPIPMVHCENCGPVPVPEKQLPVVLPEIQDYLPRNDGKSPLAKVKKFMDIRCPLCGGKANRETDTLDTFVDSSWYYLRYTDPKNKKKFADAKKMDVWIPVDLYSGGAEHTTMHLLYSRFWHKALFDMKLVHDTEPYVRRMNRGLIMGPDGRKMSKRWGNVVNPDMEVKRLGADTMRMYLAFIGPYNEVGSYPWNPDGVVGMRRFLERVWRLSSKTRTSDVLVLDAVLHKTIKKVGEDIRAMKFNTAISALMVFLNAIEKQGSAGKVQWGTFLKLLAPFAPHITEELWYRLGNPGRTGKKSIHLEKWPQYDEGVLKDETITIAVQVDGKTRGEAIIAADADKGEHERIARKAVAERLIGMEVVKIIVVPNRLVNFVLKKS